MGEGRFKTAWRDLSVVTKLYFVVGIMGLLIATELLTLRFAMHTLSSVRAFVGGEGLWSKGQKTAVIELRRYADTHDEADYQAFLHALEVPLGDHQARTGLMSPHPDLNSVKQGFEKGHIHPADVPGVIYLIQRFYWTPHLARAITVWTEADEMMAELMKDAADLRAGLKSNASNSDIQARLAKIESINARMTVVEDEFSSVLGEGSRWLESMVMKVLLALVLTVESTGLLLTISFSRNLSRSLRELAGVANRVGGGDFSEKAPVRSKDELGRLASSLNAMTDRLKETIGDRKLAEQANETKSAFLANMSHEIRTPISAMLGFTDVLKDPQLSDQERNEYLGIIERNGKSLLRVIDDILDLSKVEAGALLVEEIEFSLSALLEDVVRLFDARAKAQGLNLSLDLQASARTAVRSDPTRIRQVVSNLIGNAVKFTSHGFVKVYAEVVPRAGQTSLIRVCVEDSGIGISQNEQNKLFAPFVQADSTTTRRYGGTGLGLSLSKRLAEALGGDVYIRSSTPGRGSVIVAEFANRGHHAGRSTAPKRKTPVGSLPSDDLRILFVEDSADVRTLVKLLLKKHRLKVDFAENGRQGVERALEGRYSLVFMDIQMPEMDGYQALKSLRDHDYKMPVLALTAHAMKEDRDRIRESGFNGYVAKPFDESSLLSAISRYAANGFG